MSTSKVSSFFPLFLGLRFLARGLAPPVLLSFWVDSSIFLYRCDIEEEFKLEYFPIALRNLTALC